jgi:hypothetical protein
MAEEKFGIVVSDDLGKSLIMPSVTIHIPMPPGAAIPAQDTQPGNPPPQAPADSSKRTE